MIFQTRLHEVVLISAIISSVSCGQGGTPQTVQAPGGPPAPAAAPAPPKADPWFLPPAPPKSDYSGPLFTLSHAYPAQPVPPPNPLPWRTAIGNGPITVANSAKYVKALKDYIAADMRTLLFDYAKWNPEQARWFNQPWLGPLREPIHGVYVGTPEFPADMFPRSGLKGSMGTYVLVYYDKVAATSLQRVWGPTGMDPVPGITAGGAQFPEGSIIVKPAFTTADAKLWPPMQGAFTWQIYAPPINAASSKTPPKPTLQTVQLLQFDIIVKDSVSAPKTQWVFSTLVYDGSASGDNWDKLVPLGVMWGNDPGVKSPESCDPLQPGSCPRLSETWINAAAPLYAKETLGWGGRLSGPNDGAVDTSAAVQYADKSIKPYNGRYAMSSCMSCHGPAEYSMESFLLPSPATCKGDQCSPTVSGQRLVYFDAGTPDFLRWFQDRPGTEPQDKGSIALDYDMVYAFKSLPAWYKATGQTGKPHKFVHFFNDYRGRSRPE
jgi:hypothetical protein